MKNYLLVFGLLFSALFSLTAQRIKSPVQLENNLHLLFTENKNQWDPQTAFRARLTPGFIDFNKDHFHIVFFNEDIHEMLHQHKSGTHPLSGHVFNIRFVDANPNVTFTQNEKEKFHYNYFLGSDPTHWASDVCSYGTITYENIYNGINIQVKGQNEQLIYDYIVQAGADVSQIKVKYEGVNDLRIKNGDLVYSTTASKIKELKPYAYQIIQNQKVEVPCNYILVNDEVRFEFPKGYNTNEILIIDPTLIFSSYTGSTADNFGYTATYDDAGNLYAGGNVFANTSAGDVGGPLGNYPTVGAFQTTFQGGVYDMAISKFNATGTTLLYSTYLGGAGDDQPHSMFVNPSNELYILGSSSSTNFPTVAGSYDLSNNGQVDIVVVKLSSSGSSLLASTYLGGSDFDGAIPETGGMHDLIHNYADEFRGEIILDSLGFVYVASYTKSNNFPTTAGVIQPTFGGDQDGVLFKMNANLTSLLFSTYVGGARDDAAYSIKLDLNRNIFITGGTLSNDLRMVSGAYDNSYNGDIDGFIYKINNTGTTLMATTYLGTSAYDQSYFIEIDRFNNVYVYGQTLGAYIIIGSVYSNTNGRQFVQKLDNTLSTTLFSTVFGAGRTTTDISPTAFLVDRCDNIYMSGWGGNVNTGYCGGSTLDLATTSDAYLRTTDGSDFYFIVLERNAVGLLYATYFGGNGPVGEHVDGGTSRFDREGVIYEAVCAGCGRSSLFPTTPGAWSNTNRSANCNLAALKFEMNLAGTNVDVRASPRAAGCVPLTVNFVSVRTNVRSVLWVFGDGATSTLFNPTHTYTDTGIFTVMLIGTDSTSCNIVDTAYLSVEVDDDSISANFTPNLIIDCYSRRLFAYSKNYPTTTYTWNISDGFTSTNDTIVHVFASPGTYTISLKVDDPTSCNGTQLVTRNITIEPVVDLNIRLSDTAGCFPLTINFTNSTASPRAYYWDFGDGDTSTLKSPTHTFTEGGTYTVNVYFRDTTTCNDVDTATIQITVYNDTVTPLYHIDRIFYGCDSVKIMVQSFNTTANSIQWNFGDGTTSTSFIDQHTYKDSGLFQILYIVVDSSKRCRMIDTMFEYVSLNPLDAVFDISDTNACVPADVVFTDASPYFLATNYWSFGDGTSDTGRSVIHTYTSVNSWNIMHIIIDSSVCNFADTSYAIIQTRNDSTVANFTATILSECDSNLTIQFTNTSVNALQFEWNFGDGTSSTLANPTHTWTVPGWYTVQMISIDSTRCHPRDTAYARYQLKANAIADFDVLSTACSGVAVYMDNLSNPAAIFTWYFSDGTSSTQFEPTHIFNNAGTYTITLVIRDTNTCDVYDTLTKTINILAFPIADFMMDRDSFYYLDAIQFTNLSQNFTDVIWNFGNGDTSILENPLYTYPQIHSLTPCIIAYIEGTTCADTFCKNIYINFEARIGVPNAFTPNGDGINDEVRVEGKGIVELTFMIFNRWGEKVFESRDQQVGWNGIYKGQMQEMDVYAYTVKARFLDDTRKTLTGNITLLK
ncbi:MAG: PKD domain-containing protein [Bacteroidota bacterium]